MTNTITPTEYHFIIWIRSRIGEFPHDISTIKTYLMRSGLYDVNSILRSLISKKIISLSPDGNRVKWTSYGLEAFRGFELDQKDWESKPVEILPDYEEEEIVFHEGDVYKPMRFIQEIIKEANKSIEVEDNYINEHFMDLLYLVPDSVSIRIITREKGLEKILLDAIKKIQKTKSNIKIRYSCQLHSRNIIIDKTRGWNFTDSLKDLGIKDGRASKIKKLNSTITSFDKKWEKSKDTSRVVSK